VIDDARRRTRTPVRDDASFERVEAPLVEDETEWSECLFEGTTLSGVDAQHVRLVDARLRGVALVDAVLARLDARDCLIADSDLANAACVGAVLTWVDVTGSRATGLDLTQSVLNHVSFRDCKLDLASLRFAKATEVEFRDCTLAGADLTGAQLARVTFERCDLTGADLSSARLEEVDLRTCTLESLRGVGALRGATLDAAQVVGLAPSLAVELGIVVSQD
jgi:uncharacterized protein YjbI with pentapeptide repeats